LFTTVLNGAAILQSLTDTHPTLNLSRLSMCLSLEGELCKQANKKEVMSKTLLYRNMRYENSLLMGKWMSFLCCFSVIKDRSFLVNARRIARVFLYRKSRGRSKHHTSACQPSLYDPHMSQHGIGTYTWSSSACTFPGHSASAFG
jgi:hypothetical protein